MLEIKNIYKTFNPGTINEKVALNGLSLKLNEGDFAAGQEYQTVRYSIKAGACKLRGKTAFCADSLHQFCFYRFLTHNDLLCSQNPKSPLRAQMRVLRAYCSLFLLLSIYKKGSEHRNKTACFLWYLWGRRRSHEVFP